ncbi:hypothetical protein WA026_019316 [Henosepilachna vigintioctopunctata]|uniref:ARID domain-containing protein n=1 Tax=Henosepilachna vigintioctopunctata TaxID=420089 RepID=A0AAW1U1E9_9CUCU
MLHRWGPNFKELMAIKKYLQTQNINLTQRPWIGGMEVDLPRLYQNVQSLGWLKEVIEKEKWSKVSDIMRIPKSAQDSHKIGRYILIARNTMSMWFKNSEPTVQEIEQKFSKHVVQRQNHICVHSGSIDSDSWGYGFAVSKNSPFARHAWNLKVLTNISGSVLRSLGL